MIDKILIILTIINFFRFFTHDNMFSVDMISILGIHTFYNSNIEKKKNGT